MGLSNVRLSKILDGILYGLLVLSCLAIPFAIDTKLMNPFVLPKIYIVYGVVMLGIAIWTVRSIVIKKITYYRSTLDKIFLPLLGVVLVSAIFSDARYASLTGRSDFFTLSFLFLVSGWLIYSFVNQTITNIQRWQGLIDTLVGVGAIVGIILTAKIIYKGDILEAFTGSYWSTIDIANSLLAVFLAAIFLLATGQISKKDLPAVRQLLYALGMVSTFVALMVINFTVIWWLVVVGLAFLVVLGNIFLKEAKLHWVVVQFAIMVGVLIMIFFGTPRLGPQTVPAEIVLNNSSSWNIAKSSVGSGSKNALIGNGIGTFHLAFSHFRDSSFNSDNNAWSFRFNQPFSTAIAMLVEGGLLLVLAFLAVVIFVIGLVVKGLQLVRTSSGEVVRFFSEEEEQTAPFYEVMTVVVPWLMITVGMFWFFYGPVMWWMWWLLTACLVSGLSFTQDLFEIKEFRLTNKPEYSLSLSFIAIVIVAAMIVAGIGGTRVYAAEKMYAQAIKASGDNVENLLKEAISLNGNIEMYHLALAQYYLSRATELSKAEQPNIQEISVFVEKAVNESRRATELSPQSVVVWENLAVMYENAAALIPEARDWAIKSLEKANELESSNPVLLWKLGNNFAATSNYNEAIKKYEAAVALKPNFTPAWVSLGQAYEQTRDMDKALDAYQNAAILEPNNTEFAYQYGRTLYNRNAAGDREKAEEVWTRILQVQPNFSNVLYSLGLLYETRGERSKALSMYRKVQELNPTNKDIKTKINSLR